MADGDGAAVGVYMGRVVGKSKLAQHRERLRREGLVQLDDVHLVEPQPGAGENLARRRRRPDAHDARRDARRRHADEARVRGRAVGGGFRGDDERRGAVVDAGGVAGRHGFVRPVDRLQLGELFGRRLGARVLVAVDDQRLALALGHAHGGDFIAEHAGRLRRRPALLAAQRESVLVGARDAVIGGDIVGGLRHGIDAIARLHRRVDEAPADSGVVDRCGAREGAVRLRHDEGRAAHALDAAG